MTAPSESVVPGAAVPIVPKRKECTLLDDFIMKVIELAPAVGVLIFVIIRQDQRNQMLVEALVNCYQDCEDRIDDDDDPRQVVP